MKSFKYLFILFAGLLLTACATVSHQSLGISETQWQQYTPEERAQYATNYRQTQRTRRGQKTKSGRSTIQVNIQKGRALMPPYSSLQPYDPISFQIKEGRCNRKVSVISKANPRQKTTMSVCYSNQTLYLDASPYELDKAYGSIQLKYMPLWKRGFTYPGVSTSGLARLTDVNISVKAL